MKNRYIYPLFAAVILLASGCASNPTLGDRMLSQGVGTQELGVKWNEGNELVIRGEETKKEGQNLEKEVKMKLKKGIV